MTDLRALFAPATLGALSLRNRIAMAPMTRSRAIDNVPNELMAEYYAQRADAGLIITEGTAPSPEGLGYARIPGVFSDAQAAGWKKVTDAVHAKGGRIVVQLMHTGRVGHPANLPAGARLLAPSAVPMSGEMYTDAKGPQPYPVAEAMSAADVEAALEGYVHASKTAIAAGFDGVELHGANGYLIEQFLHPHTNRRDDAWGGSVERRNAFAVEAARRVGAAIGANRVGIRLSPYGVFNDMPPYEGVDEAFFALIESLAATGIEFVHLVNHGSMGTPPVPASLIEGLRKRWARTVILSGGYDRARAEADVASGLADLVAFGRPFLSNPDLVARLKSGAALSPPDFSTFYTPGAKGYTDYPTAG